MLEQYGAQIIKADPPSKTGMNNTPYLQWAMLCVFQGKRSLLTDIATAPGQEILRRLVGWSDVVVHNCLDGTKRNQRSNIGNQVWSTGLYSLLKTLLAADVGYHRVMSGDDMHAPAAVRKVDND